MCYTKTRAAHVECRNEEAGKMTEKEMEGGEREGGSDRERMEEGGRREGWRRRKRENILL